MKNLNGNYSALQLNQWVLHRLKDSRCAHEQLPYIFKYSHFSSFEGFDDRQDGTIHLMAAFLSESA